MSPSDAKLPAPPDGDTIFVLTDFGRKLLKYGLFLAVLLFAASMLIFNWPLLMENPFSSDLHWILPIQTEQNAQGNVVVVDRNGKRIIVLDPDRQVRSIIQANPLSRRGISCVFDIAVDDKYIYVLDFQQSANGAQIDGERILRYDLNGSYEDCLYEIPHPAATQRNNVLCDVSCFNGKVFVLKRETERISAFQIVNHELKEVQTLFFPGKSIFTSSFLPDTRTVFAAARDAHYYLHYQNDLEELPRPDSGTHWNDVCISPSGDRYYLDSNHHRIIQSRPNVRKKELIQFTSRDGIREIPDAFCLRISLQDDILSWCTFTKNEVIFFNVSTWTRTVSRQVHQPFRVLFFRGVLWLCALFLLTVICRNFFRLLKGLIRIFRERRRMEDSSQDLLQRISSTWDLYGKNILALLFAFIAATCVISFFYADRLLNTMESSLRSTAAELRNLPPAVFGDHLADITSARDYNGKSFQMVQQIGNSICFSEEGAMFDMGFSVFRRLPNGDYMYVIDTMDRYPVGKIIERKNPDFLLLNEQLATMHDQAIRTWNMLTQDGERICCVLTRIFDSSGNEAGIILVSCSKEKINWEIRGMIAKVSIDLLMLFIIFILVYGEIKLILEFRKLRKTDPVTGKLLHTVCEGHRPCQFLMTMSIYLDAAFLPTLAGELAKSSGFSAGPELQAALPLSLRGFTMVIALLLGGVLGEYHPGSFLKKSTILSVGGFLIQIYAVMTGSYAWFLAGISVLGLMLGMKFALLDSICASGMQPEKRYRNLVFVNTESLIAAAVGTSVGSLLCANIGYISVFILGILLELVLVVVTGLFIADDIGEHDGNISLRNPRTLLPFAAFRIRENMRHILHPDSLTLLLCVMVPVSILGQFDSYVLPLYNAGYGYPQLMTGFTGTVTKILALLLIPAVFNRLAERGNRFPIFAGMFLMMLAFLFCAFDSTLLVVGCLLLVITIFSIVFVTAADRLRLVMATRDHVKYTEVVGFYHSIQHLGTSVAPFLLGGCLSLGFRAFSLIFGVLLLILMIVFGIFSGDLRRSRIGIGL